MDYPFVLGAGSSSGRKGTLLLQQSKKQMKRYEFENLSSCPCGSKTF
jgi:hypothetical protein